MEANKSSNIGNSNSNKSDSNRGQEPHVQAVWFAAGTAAFIACLERAVLVSFVEQWRVLVFLALNLLLLAILFTSSHPNYCCSSPSIDPHETDNSNSNIIKSNSMSVKKSNAEEEPEKQETTSAEENVDDDEVEFVGVLSKEELNERAEAFIAMFRQQLASDAKTNFGFDPSRSCRLQSLAANGGGGGADKVLCRQSTAAISYATHSGTRMGF